MNEADEDGHLVGRMILAAADGDGDQFAHLFRMAQLRHRDEGFAVFVVLACFAGTLAEQALGEDWRSMLGAALNGLEMR